MLQQLLYKLDIIAPAITALLTFIILVKRKNQRTLTDYVLTIFLLIQVLLNSMAAVLQSMSIYNLWLYHLNCILVHLLFNYFFVRSGVNRAVIRTGLSIFCVCGFLLEKYVQPYDTFPSYLFALSCFILLLYGFFFLVGFINRIPNEPILSVREFWIMAGVFVYFGSSFFIYLSYNYLSITAPRKVYLLWQLHNIFLCFGCILFLSAIKSKKWVLK